jgi:hypothetical protein
MTDDITARPGSKSSSPTWAKIGIGSSCSWLGPALDVRDDVRSVAPLIEGANRTEHRTSGKAEPNRTGTEHPNMTWAIASRAGWEQCSGMSDVSIQRDTKGRFLTGNKAGPGRALGSRNRLTEDFLRDLSAAWREHGADALTRCATESPDVFVKVVSSLMPREVNVDVDIHAEVVGLLQTFRDYNHGRVDAALEKMARKILIDVEPQPADRTAE